MKERLDGGMSQVDSGAYQMGNYTLKCMETSEKFDDEYTLHFSDNALIQAEYQKEFKPIDSEGVWRYFDWLPAQEISSQTAGTVTYQAKELGERIGFTNLWIAFHGYWPGERRDLSDWIVQRHGGSSNHSENERPFL